MYNSLSIAIFTDTCSCRWPRHNYKVKGHAIAQAVSRRLPTAGGRIRTQVSSCGICGGQSGTGAGFSEYFGFPYQFLFHRLFHIYRLRISSGAVTIGQLMADVPSGLSFTPLQDSKLKTKLQGEKYWAIIIIIVIIIIIITIIIFIIYFQVDFY
jgi:hypothetical protein